METKTLFGGAIVELNVLPAQEQTSPNPHVAPTLTAFVELYRLAHHYHEEEAFRRGFEAFLDEMLVFLEDRYIDKSAESDLVSEMEDFMNQRYAKKDEK